MAGADPNEVVKEIIRQAHDLLRANELDPAPAQEDIALDERQMTDLARHCSAAV